MYSSVLESSGWFFLMNKTPDIYKQFTYICGKSSKTALSERRFIRIKVSRSSLDLPSKALEFSKSKKCLLRGERSLLVAVAECEGKGGLNRPFPSSLVPLFLRGDLFIFVSFFLWSEIQPVMLKLH